MSTFPAYLQHYMEERGMNQRQLAEAAGLKEATVSRYLNGQREPKVSTLLTLCSALEVTPNDLTGIYSEPGWPSSNTKHLQRSDEPRPNCSRLSA